MKTIEQWLSLVEVIIWWNLTWILDTEWCSVNMFGISIGALNSKKNGSNVNIFKTYVTDNYRATVE